MMQSGGGDGISSSGRSGEGGIGIKVDGGGIGGGSGGGIGVDGGRSWEGGIGIGGGSGVDGGRSGEGGIGIKVDGGGIGIGGGDGGIGVEGGDRSNSRDIKNGESGSGFPWAFVVPTFVLLTFLCAMAVYHSRNDVSILTFVVTSYVLLVLLFCCLWFHKRAAPGSAWRSRLKAYVCALIILLTFFYCYMVRGKVAGFTLEVALLIWLIPGASAVGAFYTFIDEC